ncbi:MAG: VWA domain-containing protein [Armatimonadetes bacterium]|nr:VWA domain-containing protein [Armatimonadota bacterium]
MQYAYSEWDEDLARQMMEMIGLIGLFHQLLLMTNGDVDQAFRLLKELQKRGLVDSNLNLDDFRQKLEEENLIRQNPEGGYNLTRKGERQIRSESLEQIFSSLRKSGLGDHGVPIAGLGKELLPETRPYEFGDPPEEIDFQGTFRHAMKRGLDDLRIKPEDFQVFETEMKTSCATVLLLDISHSMILYGEDRITPAKRVALALCELIMTRYPKDDLHVVAFGDDAREIKIGRLPYLSVGPYHTNTKAALELAQRILLRKKQTNKQIFMITDGKPSAIYEGKELYKNPFGLDPKIVNQTLREADACRRHDITITTFMVARDSTLVDFVERLSRTNNGRAYLTSPGTLGEYLLVDYMRNRKKTVR